MTRPVMTFQVGEAIDFHDQLTNGPIVLFWGQTEFVPPPAHIEAMWPDEPPKLSWIERRRGYRPWRVLLRLQPPAEENLDEWGGRVAAAAGTPWNPRERTGDNCTAVFLPAIALGRDAGEALAKGATILHRLQGFDVVGLQVVVEGVAA